MLFNICGLSIQGVLLDSQHINLLHLSQVMVQIVVVREPRPKQLSEEVTATPNTRVSPVSSVASQTPLASRA